jgi:hypothetical protein
LAISPRTSVSLRVVSLKPGQSTTATLVRPILVWTIWQVEVPSITLVGTGEMQWQEQLDFRPLLTRVQAVTCNGCILFQLIDEVAFA